MPEWNYNMESAKTGDFVVLSYRHPSSKRPERCVGRWRQLDKEWWSQDMVKLVMDFYAWMPMPDPAPLPEAHAAP